MGRATFALLVVTLPCFAFTLGGRHSSHSSSHSSSHKSKSSHASKTVHVRQYTRKDGTIVRAHDRRPAGTAAAAGSFSTTHQPFRAGYVAAGHSLHPTALRDSHGRIKRSKAARAMFSRDHPCPSTGSARGPCRGYVVDHLKPLECGGADDPSNMQWQTTADAKAKDKKERYCP